MLSATGQHQIDSFVGSVKDTIADRPLVIEGYTDQPIGADDVVFSRSRALLVARYIESRFHLKSTNIGLVPLNSTTPPSSGKASWDGACIVLLPKLEVR